jgi:hypothetical protein
MVMLLFYKYFNPREPISQGLTAGIQAIILVPLNPEYSFFLAKAG